MQCVGGSERTPPPKEASPLWHHIMFVFSTSIGSPTIQSRHHTEHCESSGNHSRNPWALLRSGQNELPGRLVPGWGQEHGVKDLPQHVCPDLRLSIERSKEWLKALNTKALVGPVSCQLGEMWSLWWVPICWGECVVWSTAEWWSADRKSVSNQEQGFRTERAHPILHC